MKVNGHFENTFWSLDWKYTVCESMRFSKIESIRSCKVNYTVFLRKLYGLWKFTVHDSWKEKVLAFSRKNESSIIEQTILKVVL